MRRFREEGGDSRPRNFLKSLRESEVFSEHKKVKDRIVFAGSEVEGVIIINGEGFMGVALSDEGGSMNDLAGIGDRDVK